MGDKYEVLDVYQNNAVPAVPAASNVSPSGSPAGDITPLLDPEVELLKSSTDLYTRKFEPESGQFLLSLSMFE
ncbi:hypothetical protein ACH3XW_26635 [Acanthocheilonema viteae]